MRGRGSRATAPRSPSPTTASPATGSTAAPGPDGSLPEALFCENESNAPRVFGSEATTAVSEGRHQRPRRLGRGDGQSRGRRHEGRRCWYRVTVAAGGKAELRLRLHQPGAPARDWAGDAFDDVVAAREQDADEFYAAIAPDGTPPEQMRILRQACAGLVWSKQIYPYNVRPLAGRRPRRAGAARGAQTRSEQRAGGTSTRSTCWRCPTRGSTRGSRPGTSDSTAIPWAHLDPAFAKYQLIVLLREWFQHPNGALPAYEWNFDDVNPPVHVMAALRVFVIDGGNDREFLERVFQKLLLNFTWWLNRQDPDGNNVFGGGFLGLDNISPIDRSNLPDGPQARAGRRHGVDGLLRALDARSSRSSSSRRTTSTGTW